MIHPSLTHNTHKITSKQNKNNFLLTRYDYALMFLVFYKLEAFVSFFLLRVLFFVSKKKKELNFTFGHEISIILYVYTKNRCFCVCAEDTYICKTQTMCFFEKRIANSHCPPKNFITEPTIIT